MRALGMRHDNKDHAHMLRSRAPKVFPGCFLVPGLRNVIFMRTSGTRKHSGNTMGAREQSMGVAGQGVLGMEQRMNKYGWPSGLYMSLCG